MSQFKLALLPILNELAEIGRNYATDYLLVVRHENTTLCFSKGFTDNQKSQVVTSLEPGRRSQLEIKPVLHSMKILELTGDSDDAIESQFSDLLTSITQNICKRVAKEWIKAIEPNKQAYYPYKSFNSSKPPWWPLDVNHIEPDHLDKPSRLRLMISMLRNLKLSWKLLHDSVLHLSFRHEYTTRLLNEIFYIALLDRALRGLAQPYYCHEYVDLLDDETINALHGDMVLVHVSDLGAFRNKGREKGLLMVSQITENAINELSFAVESIKKVKRSSKRRKVDHVREASAFPKRYTVPVGEILAEDNPVAKGSLVLTSETAPDDEWLHGDLHLDYSNTLFDDFLSTD